MRYKYKCSRIEKQIEGEFADRTAIVANVAGRCPYVAMGRTAVARTGGSGSTACTLGSFNNCTATGGTAFTLPTIASAVVARLTTIKNTGTANITITPHTGEAINALANGVITVQPGGWVVLQELAHTHFAIVDGYKIASLAVAA